MLLLGLVGVAMAGSAEVWKLSWQEVSATPPLNTRAVHQGLDQVRPALIACLEDPRLSVPEVMTAIDLRWRVGDDGVAHNLIVQGIELAGSELEPCLGAAMRGVTWSGPGAEGARLSARIDLERTAAARSVASRPRGAQGEGVLRPEVIPNPRSIQPQWASLPYPGSELERLRGAAMRGATGSSPRAEGVRLSGGSGREGAAGSETAASRPRGSPGEARDVPIELPTPGKVQAHRKSPPPKPPQTQVRLMSSFVTTAPATPATTSDWLSRDSLLFACYTPYLSEGPLRVHLVGEVDRQGEVRWHTTGRDVPGKVAGCAQDVFSAQKQAPGTRLDFTLDFRPPAPPPPAPVSG